MRKLIAEQALPLEHWKADTTCEVYNVGFADFWVVNKEGLYFMAYPSYEAMKKGEGGYTIDKNDYDEEDFLLWELWEYHNLLQGEHYAIIALGCGDLDSEIVTEFYESGINLNLILELFRNSTTIKTQKFESEGEKQAYLYGVSDGSIENGFLVLV